MLKDTGFNINYIPPPQKKAQVLEKINSQSSKQIFFFLTF